MKSDGSGQRKTQKGVCSRAHGKWAGPIEYKLSRGEGDIYRPFGTGTLNRTTSGVEARGKTVWNRCQTGLLPMLRPDFGTASPARGLSVASWRGEAVIYWLFVHKMPLFHGRCLDPSPRLFRGLFYPTDFNPNFLTVNSFGKLKQLTIATDTLTAVRGTLKTSHIADYQAPIKPCHFYYRCLS